MGRTIAIGDIHGASRALAALLDAIQPTPDDQIIALGDYVSRGIDSAGVIERLIALRLQTQLVCLRGSHEEMMMRSRNNPAELRFWLSVGGEMALMSYAPLRMNLTLRSVPDSHWEFLDDFCVDRFETETHLFAHGGVDPELPMASQSPAVLRWKSFGRAKPHESGKVLICGHTPQSSGLPNDKGFAICIDTGAGSGGPITALDVNARTYWQATEDQKVSRGPLMPPS
jgi:serine/threonine protein phosphatase 1